MTRNELIAFINTFNKITSSIEIINKMFERRIEVKLFIKHEKNKIFIYFIPTFIILIILLLVEKFND